MPNGLTVPGVVDPSTERKEMGDGGVWREAPGTGGADGMGMQEAAEEAMATAMQDAGGCGVGLGSDGRIALRQGYCHARGRRPISGGDCA